MKAVQFCISVIVTILAITINSLAQTGIYTYNSNDKFLPNVKTAAIHENKSGQIKLLNICSDPKYKMHSVQLLEVNTNGENIKNTSIEVSNLHELIDFKDLNNDDVAIFGNIYVNKTYNPFLININSSGKQISDNKLQQVYSTLLSNVLVHDSDLMLLYSKVGKNNLYNISLHKINNVDGSIVWLRKISSENNEEADDIVASEEGNYYILGKKYNDDVSEFVPIIYYINSNGEQKWKKALEVPSNFNSQSLIINKNKLVYTCSYTKSQTGFSETKVYFLSTGGEIIHSNNISDFSSNGILALDADSYLIYGSQFIVDQKQVVTKGKYVIVNKQLSNIYEKTLDQNDKPDAGMNWETKSSSDFVCATNLSNDRIALGGKVFIPNQLDDKKHNASLFMIINNDGTY